jgi:uncharacterized damage-inducible protein DinB
MTEFKSRAVMSLAGLHETELRSCLATWKRFKASGTPMPEAHGDAAYESAEHLIAHVQGAARSYMMWIRQVLESPVTDMELVRDVAVIVPRLDAYMEETLDGWRRHLAMVTDEQLQDRQYKSRWGEMFDIEQMLEHAVVHPMRHRAQLERLLAAAGR